MSESAAQSWLSGYDDQIPALDIYHQQALEALENEASSLGQLADIIARDPGMSISLYRQVNSRQQKAGRPMLGTIHNALGLLGDKAVSDFVIQHKTLGKARANNKIQQAYHQLISQGYHLLSQLDMYTAIHGVASINEIRSAAVLYNIGELCACLFDYEHYRQYRERCKGSSDVANDSEAEFGFEFQTLGRVLASQWYLPELLTDALSDSQKTGRKAILIQLAAKISRQAETGWAHPAMQDSMKASAEFLGRSQQEIETKTRSVAIQSARDFPIADVFPAAARLILLPDVEKPAPVTNPEKVATKTGSVIITDTIRNLVRSPEVTPTQIISTTIEGLYNELKFSRVVLISPSQNQQTLTARMGKGLEPDSPFNSIQIDTARSGVLKSLMVKPQALWVKSANYRKYSAMLPGIFRATCLSENFFLMSLFIDKRPVGFVYCDRTSTDKDLDERLYCEFKSCLMMANKALKYISQRNRGKAA